MFFIHLITVFIVSLHPVSSCGAGRLVGLSYKAQIYKHSGDITDMEQLDDDENFMSTTRRIWSSRGD